MTYKKSNAVRLYLRVHTGHGEGNGGVWECKSKSVCLTIRFPDLASPQLDNEGWCSCQPLCRWRHRTCEQTEVGHGHRDDTNSQSHSYYFEVVGFDWESRHDNYTNRGPTLEWQLGWVRRDHRNYWDWHVPHVLRTLPHYVLGSRRTRCELECRRPANQEMRNVSQIRINSF